MVHGKVHATGKNVQRSFVQERLGRNQGRIGTSRLHLVKHTANIVRTTGGASIGMGVVVVQLRSSHADVGRLWSLVRCSHRVGVGGDPCRSSCTAWTSQVVRLSGGNLLSVVDFGHPSDTTAAQPRILVAVPPAVHRSLNESSLSSQTGIQLGQSPSDRVAFGFVDQSVASILILGAACARIHTILRLEIRRQRVHVHRLHVTSNRVLHFHPIPRVLESYPLDSVVVLAHHQRRRGWYRSWGGVWVGASSGGWARV